MTGYTARLKDKNFDIANWLKQDLIRAMGICFALRDDGDLSEDEILKSFSPNITYYNTSLERAEQMNLLFEHNDLDSLRSLYEKQKNDAQKSWEETNLAVKNDGKEEFLKARAEAERLLNKALEEGYSQDSVVVGTLDYALKQIEQTIDFEFRDLGPHEDYKPPILSKSFEQWMNLERTRAQEEIVYNQEKIRAEKERATNSQKEYRAFLEFVDRETKT